MARELMMLSQAMMAALFVCCLYQGFYTLLTLVKKPHYPAPACQRRYAVLICARNEQAVLPQLLESIRAQDYPGGADVYVAADNCTDATAAVARAGGATCFERFDREQIGKGYALDYLLHRIWALGRRYDGYFVFDADNLLQPDFLRQMDAAFGPECPIVTGYRNSKNYRGWIAGGYALCFIREARYLNAARMMLGTSCTVTGTGFLVSEQILREAGGWPWHLLCEDFQFSAEQILAGRRIGYCANAEFFDEQPETLAASIPQRMRWCKGFMQVLTRYGFSMARGALRGNFACADVLLCNMPMILFSALSLIFAAASSLLAGHPAALLGTVAMMAAGSYLSLLGMGALACATEWKHIHASAGQKVLSCFTFPLYMATYLPIALAACFAKVGWTPVRHTVQMDLGQLKARGRKTA